MRVVVAEDLYLLRDGLVRLLEAHGLEIAAAVGDAPSLARALLTEQPYVAIVDVRLPPTFTDDGLRAAIEARRAMPGLPVLVLSQYVEQLYARELLADKAGGVGYLLKDRVFNDDQFVDAVRAVAAGGTVMDPEVVTKLLGRQARHPAIRGQSRVDLIDYEPQVVPGSELADLSQLAVIEDDAAGVVGARVDDRPGAWRDGRT